MPSLVSSLIENITGSYSKWPLGYTKLMMVNPQADNVNARYVLSQDGKTYHFISRLYIETIERTDAFFADYFAYLDTVSGFQVGPQTLDPYYGLTQNKRVQPGGIYGIPVMRVK